ncbi:MAG: Ppx/GppA family phosphatase [Myxococcales bacterium]|nr:Ppx/GppA family phosphatase [Myxococcales bacterium]
MLRAALDMGTNSFLLTIAEISDPHSVRVLEDELRIVRLGQDLGQRGSLHPDAKQRARQALTEMLAICQRHAIDPQDVRVVGTSALRDASDGPAFCEEIYQSFGLKILRISGEAEARISWRGALSSLPIQDTKDALLIDIGGGSTELIWDQGRQAHSLQVGVVRAREKFLHSDPPQQDEISAIAQDLQEKLSALPLPSHPSPVIAVAGTATTLVTVEHAIDPYDGAKVHGMSLSCAEIERQLAMYCSMPLEDRKHIPGLAPPRADLIPAGAQILATLLKRLHASEAIVSDRGVRYGLLLADDDELSKATIDRT